MHHPLQALLLSLILLAIYTTTACVATEVEIDTNGEQQQQQQQHSSAYPKQIHATFINSLRDTAVNLYWAGNANSLNEGSLQLYYGPLEPNGGEYYTCILSDIIIYHVKTFASYIYIYITSSSINSSFTGQRTIDGFAGQIFVLTQPGGYSRRGEFRLGSTSSGEETFILTEESIIKRGHNDSSSREMDAKKCRSLTPSTSPATDDDGEGFLDKCQRCAKVEGCGFALTRKGCFSSHAIATVNNVEECTKLDGMSTKNDSTTSVDAWINRATEIIVQDVEHGGTTLRFAYRCLEMAVKKAMLMVHEGEGNEKLTTEAEKTLKKALTVESELRAKLEAVFDEQDMKELLE